jgi:uncharacterized membrane protein SpoIIM required for sporulation
MVLEGLVKVKQAQKRPMSVFLLGMLYASVAVFLALWIFRSEASLVVVFLTVFAALPLVYNTLRYEAHKDIEAKDDIKLAGVHFKALKVFMYLFLGTTLALSLWFVFMPYDVVGDLFSTQLATINAVNSHSTTGAFTSWNFLSLIVVNNLKVLAFCVLFSFFFGAGAIFILTWNSSVIAAAIGTFIRDNLAKSAEVFGFMGVAMYFQAISLGLLRYLLHGVFEILAYFVGGLAGGLISVAMLNKEFEGKQFRKIVRDSVDLIILAVVITLVAGLIEVFITPIFF